MASEAGAPDAGTARFGPWRREVRAFLELFALTGVTIAQPTFDLLGKNAALFVTLDTTGLQMIALAVLLVVAPPTVLWAVEVLVGLVFPRARRYAHALLAAIVLSVLAVEALKRITDLSGRPLVLLSMLLGVLGGLLVLRLNVARMFLRYLAFAPVVFAVLFLVASPVTAVVFENDSAAASSVRVGKPNRVVMIVMDELPTMSLLDGRGQIDAELFPNFAALAADSTWFRNSTTVAPYTDEAVPAMLTGRMPTAAYQTPIAAEHPKNLFTMLGGTYRMNVHESVTRLCPAGVCAEAANAGDGGSAFGPLLETTYDLWREFASPGDTAEPLVRNVFIQDVQPLATGDRFVDSLVPGRAPELDYLHVMLPHLPWHLRGTGQDDRWPWDPGGLDPDGRWQSAWSATAGRQRHLLQVQAADLLLGRIVRRLERIGAYDDSLLIVTADHGIAFTADHTMRGVSPETYPQLAWTPLMVRAPGQSEGAVDDRPVRSVDLLPTVIDVLDASVPWRLDGRSAFGRARADDEVDIVDWDRSEVHPAPGEDFVTFSREAGFAEVLAQPAAGSPGVGTGADRLYRVGEHGGLIGRRAAPLVDPAPGVTTARLEQPEVFEDVAPRARSIPWAHVGGRLGTRTGGIPLAIAVNGTIAGVTESVLENPDSPEATFWATASPRSFRRGANEIVVYEIRGSPAAPRLRRLPAG